jgi:hypothetical protein
LLGFTIVIALCTALIVGHVIDFTFTFHVVRKSGVHIRVEIVYVLFKVHLIVLGVLIVLMAEVAVLTVVVVVAVLILSQRVAVFGIKHARLVLVERHPIGHALLVVDIERVDAAVVAAAHAAAVAVAVIVVHVLFLVAFAANLVLGRLLICYVFLFLPFGSSILKPDFDLKLF